jgi:hypothetical protein
MAQPAIAAAMGVSLSTVNRAHVAYDHGGVEALKPKPNGGRKHENMTLAEEKALLARFARAGGAGEMLNIPSHQYAGPSAPVIGGGQLVAQRLKHCGFELGRQFR